MGYDTSYSGGSGYSKVDRPRVSTAISKLNGLISGLRSLRFSPDYINSSDSRVYKAPKYEEDENGTRRKVSDGYDHRGYLNGSYNPALSGISSNIDKMNNKVEEIEKIKSALETIKELVDDFESLDVGFYSVGDLENESEGIVVVEEEGKQIVYYQYEDEDGNIVQITIPEMLNAFVTETGMKMDGGVELAVIAKEKGVNVTEAELQNMIDGVNSFVGDATSVGAFGLASKEDLNNFTTAAFGTSVDEFANVWPDIAKEKGIDLTGYETVEKDVVNELGEDVNGVVTKGSLVATALLSAFTLTGAMGKKEDENDDALSEEGTIQEDFGGSGVNSQGEETQLEETIEEGELVEDLIPEEILPEEVDPEVELEELDEELEEEIDEEIEEIVEEPPIVEDVNPIADDLQKRMKEIEQNEVPEQVEKETLTSEEIDNQARDEYYQNQENLAENRDNAAQEFRNLSEDERVSRLEDMGYSHDDAISLAGDTAKGEMAYVMGSEEKKIAEISNDIAQREGVVNHDTKYDDGHNQEYIDSNQINIDSYPTNEKVQQARAELTQAKSEYDESVNNLNESVNNANKAKEEYNNVLNNIQSTSGSNPSGWSQEQVEQYQTAADNYTQASEDAKKVAVDMEVKKANYEKEKSEYKAAYDEYRKEAIDNFPLGDVEAITKTDNLDKPGVETPLPPDYSVTVEDDGSVTIIDPGVNLDEPEDVFSNMLKIDENGNVVIGGSTSKDDES